MNVMTYGGYAARVEYDAQDRIFVGHIAGLRDIVGFHGSSVEELEQAFREAVDDYIDACKKLGQSPDKPFSGRLMFRVDPQVHAEVTAAAQLSGVSLNQWAEQALRDAAHRTIGR
jgi:predicted HicB family RNase H-like nuclease